MSELILGIDPGSEGAVGILNTKGEYEEVIDLPMLQVEQPRRKSKRAVLDLNGTDALFSMLTGKIAHVYIEDVLLVPVQSVQSMRTTFENYGMLCGKMHSMRLPFTKIASSAWKAKMMRGMEKGKGAAMMRCAQLFPQANLHGPRGGKRDDRAEALLIAKYGWLKDWK